MYHIKNHPSIVAGLLSIAFIWLASASMLFAQSSNPAVIPNPSNAAASDQVIIQFSPAATADERAAYIASIGGTVIEEIPALNAVVVSISPNTPQFDSAPNPSIVTISEPDYYVTALEDPLQSQQWALPVIGAPSAWESLPADSASVVVAVIDSGICADHPDLANRILAGYDFIEDDAVPQDDFGHGCAVAGVIAADGNNGIGIAGIAPNARIMPLRVLDQRGNGLYSNVAAAVVWAADNGAQIINLSLGGANQSSLLQNAIDYAIARNSIVIAAAGNTGGAVLYPAAYAPVIAVGSVDQNLERSSFSSYGTEIDVYAPGSDVLSTAPNGGYLTRSGTSIAAPQVAGIAALELAYGRSLTLNGGVISFAGGATPVPPVPTTPTTGEIPLMPIGARPPNIPDGYMIVYGDIQVPIDFFEVGGQFSHQGNLWPRSGPTEASPSLIPYAFDLTPDGGGQPNVSPLNQQRAIEAMATWEAVANVDFIPRTDQDDFIFFHDTTNDVDGNGNSVAANNSPVGRVGGQQTLNMVSWGAKFVIVHELGHAIGLSHEHQRPGRDTFVTIVMGNVQAGQAGNFNLIDDDDSTNIGNYDFNSVMHYGEYAFSVCNAGATPP
ncbi:MAG: S8 family serine peptidase, partial [Chitinophagaceae bacterium]|nr:S8 family serine peptidase [Anaerolineae bacterium]